MNQAQTNVLVPLLLIGGMTLGGSLIHSQFVLADQFEQQKVEARRQQELMAQQGMLELLLKNNQTAPPVATVMSAPSAVPSVVPKTVITPAVPTSPSPSSVAPAELLPATMVTEQPAVVATATQQTVDQAQAATLAQQIADAKLAKQHADAAAAAQAAAMAASRTSRAS